MGMTFFIIRMTTEIFVSITLFFFAFTSSGMTSEISKYSWGGEDWELLRRVLKAQFEVERIKYPGLFHHHHSKLINSN